MEPSTPPATTPTGLRERPLELNTERTSSDSTIAPSSLSPSAAATATQAQLGRGAPPPVPTTPRSIRDSASSTTTQLPPAHPAASLALPSSSQPHSHAVSETTDNASLLSEEGEFSDNYYDGYYADRDRDKAARGATGSFGNYSATSNSRGNKGKKVNVPRTGAPASRGKGRSRNPTGARDRDQEDVDEDDEEEPSGRDRAMSPGLSLLSAGRTTTVFDDDDEVERRDRGEELVRKRMRDRARVKKEAEKAARRRDVGGRGSQAIQPYPQQRQSHYPAASDVEGDDVRSRSASQSYGDRGRIPLVRRNTEGESQSQSRVPSTNVNRESFATSVGSQGGYFDDATSMDGTERGVASVPTSPLVLSSSTAYAPFAPLSPSIGHGASILRGVSHSESIHEEDEQDESGHTLQSVGEIDEQAYDGAGVDVSAGDEDDIDDEDDDDDEEGDGEVEYTLKDRQDAINIEHPFGLPIWKPALYKKSRSVTRNAETAVHANPSSTTLNHFAPPNVLWTIFFGSWLALICVVVSGVLWCTPWGGEKYGRVLWELGNYLFWPFGKYVEGWSDAVDGDGEENGDVEETDDEDEEERRTSQHRDVEDAGKTYGRGRARLSSSHSTTSPQPTAVQDLFNAPADGNDLPDEPRRRSATQESELVPPPNERTGLVRQSTTVIYGAVPEEDKMNRSSSESTVTARRSGSNLHDFNKDNEHSYRVRALGRTMYWVGFYLIIGPLMLTVCILCWGLVFTVPMAKLLWVLLRHLSNEPLSLHFRSPPKYSPPTGDKAMDENPMEGGIQYPLKAGQRAPPVSRRSVAVAKAQGRIFGPSSTVLLCTYQAAGLQYYKYTVDGVNILFINLLSLVFFVIADDWFIAPYVHAHPTSMFLNFIAGKGFIFVMALLSVIPLSYFIGMAVASISAQSSIGMGAVINASFGSIIEIILYCIALTQSKADLVEGSIVGSILAAVLLMPGLSMIGGAMRRKEQKFNAKSAGVTSTMLIMAIIGILTPTLFYEIYGSFQLNCTGCAPNVPGGTTSSCKSCFYEHIDPVDDPFYKNTVVWLSYYCAIILVLSYLVGLWFSLRTHASQIWQNAQPTHELPSHTRPLTAHQAHPSLTKRQTLVGAAVPQVLHVKRSSTPARHSSYVLRRPSTSDLHPPTHDDVAHQRAQHAPRSSSVVPPPPAMTRSVSHAREHSGATVKKAGEEEEGGAGGHDAPNWSRVKSASVLMSCTILYAIIAEILVDVVDVVLDGSGIPEKLLGVTLFALVPNTTEFMNAISFAINGNIALSMEIGSAYALQVCLIQAPAMLAFTAFYSIGKISMEHKAFTLVFPRWDVIAIIFSVFLLTYTYIEARANYYRGTILCLSYLVLLGGFVFAPGDRDTEDNPIFTLAQSTVLPTFGALQTTFLSLFVK